jgi:hypothetical protein
LLLQPAHFEPTTQKLAAAWAGARYHGDLKGDAWNDTALLRQLGVPGEPQTAAQAAASLYHSTAGSIAHAGEKRIVAGALGCQLFTFCAVLYALLDGSSVGNVVPTAQDAIASGAAAQHQWY